MIFKQWQQVLDGTKTQTRRPCKGEDEQYTWCTPTMEDGLITGHRILEVVEINKAGGHKLKWAVGKTYAVQPGRGKKAVGRIRITKIRRERLGDISEEDCLAEGIIENTKAFLGDSGIVIVAYECPICGAELLLPLAAYACLWNHCYGNGAWEHMKDDDVFVLEFEPCDE